jgi:hypothetical protein
MAAAVVAFVMLLIVNCTYKVAVLSNLRLDSVNCVVLYAVIFTWDWSTPVRPAAIAVCNWIVTTVLLVVPANTDAANVASAVNLI